MTTAVKPAVGETAPLVVQKLIQYLETTEVPAGLFADDVFCDLTLPTWRLQARGPAGLASLRAGGHPSPGRVPRVRYDPIPSGFVLEVEEEWDDAAGHWYCRELMRADVADDRITEISIYCTGDWNEAQLARHAQEVALLKP